VNFVGRADQIEPKLELWVGPEASYVRAGDIITDQLALSGFAARPDDLERLASLGASRVRFPLLWERTTSAGQLDWRWADAALPRLAALKLNPVLGLVHHGGGAVPGGLLDPGFAEGLADYAGAVARRFPWIDAYTPVNEPLTTARFSALYGVWFPHATGDRAFVQALLAQTRATVLSMRAIRAVHPGAALVQTEDMGRTYGTAALQEQVEFENERRWLSFDLLCGRVDEGHLLWSYLLWAGAEPRELLWFAEHACPPQVLGLNIYPTSERFLDDRLDRYPAHLHGGNGRQQYADVEAVRARAELPGSFCARLMEAHDRYGLPLAITEAHLGCTREEQLRWLAEAWQGADRARNEGADVRAVTAWSAFGSYDWDSLMTRRDGHYESGLWDVSNGAPRETALTTLARELVTGHPTSHAVLSGPGWWRRAERRQYPSSQPLNALVPTGPRLQIGPGPLKTLLEHLCFHRGLPVGDDSPWACLESHREDRLRLHWLGREPLTVRAELLGIQELNAALDLLMDGEMGLWEWEGQRFQPVPTVGAGAGTGRRPLLR
jgi:dTDP-4-dehydrorhamnose reductase